MAQDMSTIFTRRASVRATTDTSLLFGQVMFLVAVALGFLAFGAYAGRNLTYGTGFAFEIVALVMLFAQSFVARLRTGTFGVVWLYALALLLGMGLGPVIAHYAALNHQVLYQAAGGTALTVAAAGTFGVVTSRNLVRWARPLAIAFLVVILASWILVLVGTGSGNIILNLAIYGFSTAFLAINFQFLRRQATEDDVIWIATGIFVNIVNIFLTLLSILSDNR